MNNSDLFLLCLCNSKFPLIVDSNLYVLNRGTETEEQILKRLRNAKAEIEQGTSSGIFDHTLYNDNLEQCYENLKVTYISYSHISLPLENFLYKYSDIKCTLVQKLLGFDANVTTQPKSG